MQAERGDEPVDGLPVDGLAHELAIAGLPIDQLGSDVGRLAGYRALWAHGDEAAPMIRAVSVERDLGVRSTVVADLLDSLPTDRHAALMSGLSQGPTSFELQRAREIAAYRTYRDDPESLVPEHVAGMSPWLQWRLVESIESPHVSRVLAECGTARKIRNAAEAKIAGRCDAASSATDVANG